MEFLSVEVVGALTTQKIRGESLSVYNLTPMAATLHISSKNEKRIGRIKDPRNNTPVFHFNRRGTWTQTISVQDPKY
jgi:hypothetical protein